MGARDPRVRLLQRAALGPSRERAAGALPFALPPFPGRRPLGAGPHRHGPARLPAALLRGGPAGGLSGRRFWCRPGWIIRRQRAEAAPAAVPPSRAPGPSPRPSPSPRRASPRRWRPARTSTQSPPPRAATTWCGAGGGASPRSALRLRRPARARAAVGAPRPALRPPGASPPAAPALPFLPLSPQLVNSDLSPLPPRCQDGICWVYRYYSLGPAAIEWLPDGTPLPASARKGGGGGKGGGSVVVGGGGGPEGASWTWFYPYHYAPLMQVRGCHGPGRGACKAQQWNPNTAASELFSRLGRPRAALSLARPPPRRRP
jgi:hypothetical protein